MDSVFVLAKVTDDDIIFYKEEEPFCTRDIENAMMINKDYKNEDEEYSVMYYENAKEYLKKLMFLDS